MPRPSLILDTVTRGTFPAIIVFSLYLLFVGHNAPGGGFVGGLTAGIGLVLLYAGGGMDRLREVATVRYETLLGCGLLLASSTGLVSLVLGEPFQSSAILRARPPLLGEVKLVTVLFFDIGVYLIVVGLVLGLLTILGPTRAEDAFDDFADPGSAKHAADLRPEDFADPGSAKHAADRLRRTRNTEQRGDTPPDGHAGAPR
jgi:multicomponent Na+:H+ antiporter subunit A